MTATKIIGTTKRDLEAIRPPNAFASDAEVLATWAHPKAAGALGDPWLGISSGTRFEATPVAPTAPHRHRGSAASNAAK
jgi:hypothetical protein